MKPIIRYVGYFQITYTDPKKYNKDNLPIKGFFDQGTNEISFNVANKLGRAINIKLKKADGNNIGPEVNITNNSEGGWDELSIFEIPEGTHTYDIQETIPADDGVAVTTLTIATIKFKVRSDEKIQKMQLQRAGFENTDDEEFWKAIKKKQLNFNDYNDFITNILCNGDNTIAYDGDKYFKDERRKSAKKRLPFIGVKEYSLLKFGTEFYMLAKSAIHKDEIANYLSGHEYLPYFEHISDSIGDAEKEYDGGECVKIKEQRFNNPFFIELIWSYWMEQGMLMQAMNLINLRFQNIGTDNNNQLSRFDISPLRPLSHILWGFVQDEQHRLSLPRRVQEYDHEYGLMMIGRAVPSFMAADSRSKFLEAFHNLLTTTSIFYKEADDTTRIADAFPVLNSLKEVHLLLAEGNHNAYGNLTWTARNEMLMTQYIIAREEVRMFLGGRPMVPYPESWMDRIDTVRNMMGWGSTSITYFYDLAIHGEKVLLSIRYGDWSDANMPVTSAANWALAFRDSIQKYMHAYRTVTGVDLSADAPLNSAARNIQPAILIQKRVSEERIRQKRA